MKEIQRDLGAVMSQQDREESGQRLIQDLLDGGFDIEKFVRQPGRIVLDLSVKTPKEREEKKNWFQVLETLGVVIELEILEDKITFILGKDMIARIADLVNSKAVANGKKIYKTLDGDGTNDVYLLGVTHNIGPIENVASDWYAHEGERRLFTHWKDSLRVEHNDLTIAKNGIDRRHARKLLRKYNQQAALVIKPAGTFDFVLVDKNASKARTSKMDEIIKLDWGKYWPGCVRKKGMTIRSILAVQRWALRIADLPKNVQDKCDEALDEAAISLEESMQCIVGPEEKDQSGKRYIRLSPMNRESETGINAEKMIFGLSEGEEENYTVIGTAEGESFTHCLYLGFKYTRMFLDRVCAYKTVTSKDPSKKMGVTFFEKKPN